jgi:hypothetical protein
LIPEGKKPSKKYNTEHPKKGDEYRDNTGKEFPKIPHISPKKVHKSTHYKKGVSPFHFVGFTEYLEQMSKQYKGLGKTDPDPNPFLVLGLSKKVGVRRV